VRNKIARHNEGERVSGEALTRAHRWRRAAANSLPPSAIRPAAPRERSALLPPFFMPGSAPAEVLHEAQVGKVRSRRSSISAKHAYVAVSSKTTASPLPPPPRLPPENGGTPAYICAHRPHTYVEQAKRGRERWRNTPERLPCAPEAAAPVGMRVVGALCAECAHQLSSRFLSHGVGSGYTPPTRAAVAVVQQRRMFEAVASRRCRRADSAPPLYAEATLFRVVPPKVRYFAAMPRQFLRPRF